MKIAAIDLGSNTFLCLIAEVSEGKIQKILSDDSRVVRLGERVTETGKLQPSALSRARECLSLFSEAIKNHQPQAIIALTTSAARSASNAEEFIALGRDFGIPITVIDGTQEAELTFLGAFSDSPFLEQPRLVIDIGGGSTEIGWGPKGALEERYSIELGCVRLFEVWGISCQMNPELFRTQKDKLFLKFESELIGLRNKMKDTLKSFDQKLEVLAVAGTPVELGKVLFKTKNIQEIHGKIINFTALQEVRETVLKSTVDSLSKEFGVLEGRGDVLLAGAIILEVVMESLKMSSVRISTRGLRHGIALSSVTE